MVIDYLKHIGLTMNDWEFAFMQRSIQILKKLMQQFEDNGIKTSIMTWPDENVLHIENDHWLRDRFVKMQHNGILYNSIDRLMFSEPSLKILHDYDSFAVPPQDSHPSLQCHRIIADNLIKHLEKHDNL
jgi:hypothetical protein